MDKNNLFYALMKFIPQNSKLLIIHIRYFTGQSFAPGKKTMLVSKLLPASFEWVLCLIQIKTSRFFEKKIRLCNKKSVAFHVV